MKLKLDDKGAVVVQDGKPVYVHDDGKEVAFDAPATVATIGRLNGEAKGHRERAEAAEGKLKTFEGISDPAKALAAMRTVENLDQKKLIDAGQLDTLKADLLKSAEQSKAEAIKAIEDKYAPVVTKAETLEKQLHAEMIGGGFARSKFVAEKLILPPDIAQAYFGGAFKIEEGKVVGYDRDGAKIYSKARPGEPADFDEVLSTVIDAYPRKEHILKASQSSGGGANGASNGAQPGAKQMKRAAWEQLPAAQKAAHFTNGGTLVD